MESYRLESEYPVPARRLFDLLRSPACQEALALVRGAQEVSAQALEQRGAVRPLELELSLPGWDVLGRPRGAERVVEHQDWDADGLAGRWVRHFRERGQAVVWEGEWQLHVLGPEACRLVEVGQIEIRTPLVGRKVERAALAELQARHPRVVDLLLRQLGALE
ncbi:MAG TPA: hypothetical protein PK668_06965 [Myxococcota bacterium]|nr:hypothetical protein [Myxococcota bacterium]HRY92415.1 hypothetical protein [Myxococcota bacterium]HSA21841.1 hypothetical protein [Myxococcota bacterium]